MILGLILASVVTVSSSANVPVETSHPDAEGRITLDVMIPSTLFLAVAPGTAQDTFLVAHLPGGYRITSASTFIGTYRCDLVEAMVELSINTIGYRILQRSDHKEACGFYDAWKREATTFAIPDGGAEMGIYLRVNETSEQRQAGVQFGVRLTLERRGSGYSKKGE